MQIIIGSLLLIILGVFIYTWYEFHLTLRSHKTLKKTISNKGLKIIKKNIKTSDGLKISSWYVPLKNPKAVVILVHGYREANAGKARMLSHAKYLKKAGYSTLLIDLRSFGESDGNKVTLGTSEWKDVEAAYDYAKSIPENKNKKIGFYGKSMGAVASIIAKAVTGKGDFIIALTPYASFKNLFSFQLTQKGYYTPLFLPLVRIAGLFELGYNYEHYSPINLIKKINVPIFIASAKYDETIPRNDSKYLFENAKNPKEFWEAPTNHYEIFRDNPEEFQKKVLGFLSKNV